MSLFSKKQPATSEPLLEEVQPEPTPEPPAPKYIYTGYGDRLPLDSLTTPVVLKTTGNFALRTGDKLTDNHGHAYEFLYLLPQTGLVSYLICLPLS